MKSLTFIEPNLRRNVNCVVFHALGILMIKLDQKFTPTIVYKNRYLTAVTPPCSERTREWTKGVHC